VYIKFDWWRRQSSRKGWSHWPTIGATAKIGYGREICGVKTTVVRFVSIGDGVAVPGIISDGGSDGFEKRDAIFPRCYLLSSYLLTSYLLGFQFIWSSLEGRWVGTIGWHFGWSQSDVRCG